MIEIHLTHGESKIPFLSIPLGDVQRLSIRPFKWLRYVMFSICGARGELSAGPTDPEVDYETTALVDNSIYYYNTSEPCHFIDYQGLSDRDTTTTHSDQSSGCTEFGDRILERDGSTCVVTHEVAEGCDAAHLIPGSKPDEYIQRVVEDRTPMYRNTAPRIRLDAARTISSIDDIENGVLLRKDLHAYLGIGWLAFLKTPNYGLEAADVRRANIQSAHQGPAPTDTFTLHRLKAPNGYNSQIGETLANEGNLLPFVAFGFGLNVDAQFQATHSLPHRVILDYVYGVTAYKLWSHHPGESDAHGVVKDYRREHYKDITPPPPPSPRDDDEYSRPEEQGDPLDTPYIDPSPRSRRRGRRHHIGERTADTMWETEARMHAILRGFYGITPEVAAKERELKEQEDSQIKVMEWMNTSDSPQIVYSPPVD